MSLVLDFRRYVQEKKHFVSFIENQGLQVRSNEELLEKYENDESILLDESHINGTRVIGKLTRTDIRTFDAGQSDYYRDTLRLLPADDDSDEPSFVQNESSYAIQNQSSTLPNFVEEM